MKKWILLSLCVVPPLCWAGSEDRGTTTANFLKLGVGARAEAMGEAYTAVAGDATALYWNPAGLTRIHSDEAALMHAPYLASSYYDYGSYAHRRDHHAWGAGIQYFSAGSIAETDENNTPLGSFSPYDLAVSGGYAYQFSELAVGMTGKFIQSKILSSASTVAVDLGVQTRPYGDRLRLALAITNIGGKLKFEQESDPLPRAVRLGGSLQLTDHWLAALDIVAPNDNAAYPTIGTEYAWPVRDGLSLAGRLGYNSLTAGDVSGVSGLAFGFGLGGQKISFDYAFLPFGSLGLTHRLSLALKWGGDETDPASNVLSPVFTKEGP